MNARGELGIVLALLAWEGELIREQLFVAFVVLAIVTNILAGPMLTWLLSHQKTLTLDTILDLNFCCPQIEAKTVLEAVKYLSQIAAERAKLNPAEVCAVVLAREEVMGAGIGKGIAVPHARLAGVQAPVVIVATSLHGIDFQGVDDEPVRIIFLSLTRSRDDAAQVRVLAGIAHLGRKTPWLQEVITAQSPTELLGAIRVMEHLHT